MECPRCQDEDTDIENDTRFPVIYWYRCQACDYFWPVFDEDVD